MPQTNPLLAKREIPARERWQKALLVVLATAVVVGGAWYLTGATTRSEPSLLATLAAIAGLGLVVAGWLLLHRYETANTKEKNEAIRQRIADDRSGAGWTSRIGYNLRRFVFGIVILAGLLVSLAGLSVLAYQVYFYLKNGQWFPISVMSATAPYVPWLRNPQSWIGLYKLIRDALALCPLSVALIITGWMIAGLGSGIRGRVRR